MQGQQAVWAATEMKYKRQMTAMRKRNLELTEKLKELIPRQLFKVAPRPAPPCPALPCLAFALSCLIILWPRLLGKALKVKGGRRMKLGKGGRKEGREGRPRLSRMHAGRAGCEGMGAACPPACHSLPFPHLPSPPPPPRHLSSLPFPSLISPNLPFPSLPFPFPTRCRSRPASCTARRATRWARRSPRSSRSSSHGSSSR